MLALWLALLAAVGLLIGSGLWLRRSRREVGRLRRRLEAASSELQHLQVSFSRFAPQQVVERIVASGVATSAEKRQVTVLFADLVSFTALSERLAPEVLVKLLNDYFVRMSMVISEHRGHVSKFIGDGLMAFFGALEPNPWQINDAVGAALAMREALAAYNLELQAAGLPALRFGIGIHCGSAIAGVIGSHELMEFTVIGRAVNLAARVERLTRGHEVDILVTDAVRAALDPRIRVRELPPARLRGIADPAVIYAVDGIAEPASGEAGARLGSH